MTIIIYRPDGAAMFSNVTNMEIVSGVLTFYTTPDSFVKQSKKITTTVPFFIEEEIGQIGEGKEWGS
jgi:hypothetical protein